MSRALILSGGAFRGAVQLPVLEYLKEKHEYDAVYGVSVGSINGILFCQDDLKLLRKIWDDVDGVGQFLKSKWYWPCKGIYSMTPLRQKLEKYTSLTKVNIPFSAGVVSFTDGEYYNLSSDKMKKDCELWDAIQASACIAGIMVTPEIIINGEKHIGTDGGFRNIIPVPNILTYDYLDIVTCTPLDRMKMKKKFMSRDILSLMLRSIDIFEDENFDKDILELDRCSSSEIRIFSPSENPGESFSATKEDIQFRYKLGESAIHNPVIIPRRKFLS